MSTRWLMGLCVVTGCAASSDSMPPSSSGAVKAPADESQDSSLTKAIAVSDTDEGSVTAESSDGEETEVPEVVIGATEGAAAIEVEAAAGPYFGGDVLVDARYGVAPADPEPQVRAWFASHLSSDQASFQFENPQVGSFGSDESPRFGWAVPTRVSEDEDSGERLYHCWFRGDELIAVLDPARMPSRLMMDTASAE